MRRLRGALITHLGLGLTLIAPMAAAGQSAPAASALSEGTWDVRWAQAVRTSGSTLLEVQRWGDAVLELAAAGDSVHGRWTTNVLEEVNWTVSGTARDGVLHLRGTEHDSENAELDIVESVELEVTVQGDSLEGTVLLRFRGAVRPGAPRPMTGTRRGSEARVR